jgi:excisionase family DNA binding protein
MVQRTNTKSKRPEPEMVSISTAAALIDCHRNTVARLIREGHLAPVMVGTLRRIPMAQIKGLTTEPVRGVRVAGRKRGKA